MEVLHPHCAGLDVHKDSVVACVRHMVDGKVMTGVKTFKTTIQALMVLSDWLSAEGVTHIAMEATGVYWVFERVDIHKNGVILGDRKCLGAQRKSCRAS